MNLKKVAGIILIGYVIVFFITAFPTNHTNASTAAQEIDIVTTPEKVLFDIVNMKPGDWAIRTLTVSNSGLQDFSYLFSANKKSGSTKLYKVLHITVSDKNMELYNGSLEDFKRLEPRLLASKQNEELVFRVEFPSHLGNEYQGLASEVEFKFYVEGTLGGLLPVDGPKLPNTATNTFNMIAIGLAFLVGGFILYRYLNRAKKRDRKLLNE